MAGILDEIDVGEHALRLRRWRMDDAPRLLAATELSILEIGYWVRTDRTGRGYATAAARALTGVALTAFPEVERIEIRCDPANRASAAVPAKLGFRLDRIDTAAIETTAQTGAQQVWALARTDYLATERW